MTLATVRPSRAEFLKNVARFSQLSEVSTGLPDMEVDGFRRSFLLVLASVQPEGANLHAPSGSLATPAIAESSVPVTMGYVRAKAGNGVMMHNHNTNETFVVLEGRWRVSVQGDKEDFTVDLNRYDVATIPPGVHRAFSCLETDPGIENGLLLAVVANETDRGAVAAVEFSPESLLAIASHQNGHPSLPEQTSSGSVR